MGLSSPPALGMHEIEQNGSTHPYINYSPYAPPRWAHSICKKKDIFRSILRFDVRCDFCLLLLVLKAWEVFLLLERFWKHFEIFSVSQSLRKSLLLSASIFILLCASLWQRRGGALSFLFSPNFCKHRASSTGSYKDTFHYNINVLSLLIACTPPTLWCLLPTVIWHCSCLNYKWNPNLLWGY